MKAARTKAPAKVAVITQAVEFPLSLLNSIRHMRNVYDFGTIGKAIEQVRKEEAAARQPQPVSITIQQKAEA